MEKGMKAEVCTFVISAPKFRYKMAGKMKVIMKRLDEITEERSKFELWEGSVKEEIGEREEPGSFVDESEVCGRDKDKEKIVDFLINSLSSSSSEADPDVKPIAGLEDMGKATLAQQAFNDKSRASILLRRYGSVFLKSLTSRDSQDQSQHLSQGKSVISKIWTRCRGF